jgi:putative addiction module killer protein
MVEIRQTEAYFQWFNNLRDRQARARIDVRIRRLSLGNPGDVKPVGEGVSELHIDYGPGYRVYFVQRSQTLYRVEENRNLSVGADLCVRPWLRAHTQVRPYNSASFDC